MISRASRSFLRATATTVATVTRRQISSTARLTVRRPRLDLAKEKSGHLATLRSLNHQASAGLGSICASRRFFGSTSHAQSGADDGDGSHPDFMAKRTVESEEDVDAFLQKFVDSNNVALFMKGTPEQPQCGFSYQVVKILHMLDADFTAMNVLDNPLVREGVKEFSQWPTIPQLYVNGEFIGGCDIVTSMYQDGSLEETLKEVGSSE